MSCLTTWTVSFVQRLCPCGQCDHQPVFKIITWLLLWRLPRRNSLEPSEPCLRNLHQHATEPSGTYTSTRRNLPEFSGTGTLRNLPELASETYTSGTLRHSAELSGTVRNLPLEPTPAHTGTLRNFPEPELSGTFRSLPPEPAPATRTGTHRSLSGLNTPLAYAVGEKNKHTAKQLHSQLYGHVQHDSLVDMSWFFAFFRHLNLTGIISCTCTSVASLYRPETTTGRDERGRALGVFAYDL